MGTVGNGGSFASNIAGMTALQNSETRKLKKG
jgi:hypothetical protein